MTASMSNAPDLAPYLAILTSQRKRASKQQVIDQGPRATDHRLDDTQDMDTDESSINAAATGTPTAPHPGYTLAIRPRIHKQKKQKGGFCLLLARNLARFDENPAVWMPELQKPFPPILNLPAELRQDILYDVIEDDELFIPRPNSETRDLALVCKTFAVDISKVMRLWQARDDVLHKGAASTQTTMQLNTYIQDLMRPIQAMSSSLSYHTDLPTGRSKSRKLSDWLSKHTRRDQTVQTDASATKRTSIPAGQPTAESQADLEWEAEGEGVGYKPKKDDLVERKKKKAREKRLRNRKSAAERKKLRRKAVAEKVKAMNAEWMEEDPERAEKEKKLQALRQAYKY